MTSPRRFEQDLPALLAETYLAGIPDYRDDLFRQTARTRQRPAWSFLTRWIPMDITMRRVPVVPAVGRAIALALLIAALLATALFVGSQQHRVPPPFGPARNGPLAYMQSDAILVRDTVDGPERVLVGSERGSVNFAGFSPDGTRMLFSRTMAGSDYLFVADADGRGERKILESPLHDAYITWAPDSRTVAVSDEIGVARKVMLVRDDGTPPTIVDLGDAQPTDMVWRPPTGAELLVRATTKGGGQDFFLVRADGTLVRSFGLPTPLRFGSFWENSGPAWSPDGTRLAYNRVEPLDGELAGHYRVHVIRADGTGDMALPGPADSSLHEAWPLWSPDGKSIAIERFLFASDGQARIAIFATDGSAGARDIGPTTHGEDQGVIKVWTPDGTRVISYVRATGETFVIDPVTNAYEKAAWSAASEPDIRRLAP
jgi:dipeptidyl aminopeptidase/acylaminoacyl peptidase